VEKQRRTCRLLLVPGAAPNQAETVPDDFVSAAGPDRRLLKVLGEIIATAILVFFFAPILLTVSIAMKLDSPGPIFIHETKLPHSTRVIRVFRFRIPQRLKWITPVLSQTGIDKLPQMFNVLRGEMSITDLWRAGIFQP
jgi:lipopolysaccharide/colanic/teichoic acid biosynthesis glycosyltransferase